MFINNYYNYSYINIFVTHTHTRALYLACVTVTIIVSVINIMVHKCCIERYNRQIQYINVMNG